MLKLDTEPTFTAAVEIPSPWGVQRIKMVFRYMDTDEYDKFFKDKAGVNQSNEDLISDIATDWKEVDAEFSKENIAKLCKKYHQAATKIVETWMLQNTQARVEN